MKEGLLSLHRHSWRFSFGGCHVSQIGCYKQGMLALPNHYCWPFSLNRWSHKSQTRCSEQRLSSLPRHFCGHFSFGVDCIKTEISVLSNASYLDFSELSWFKFYSSPWYHSWLRNHFTFMAQKPFPISLPLHFPVHLSPRFIFPSDFL